MRKEKELIIYAPREHNVLTWAEIYSRSTKEENLKSIERGAFMAGANWMAGAVYIGPKTKGDKNAEETKTT